MRRGALLIPFVLWCASCVEGAIFVTLDVKHRNDAYDIEFDALLDAPPDKVFALLTDYGNWSSLSGIVQKSSVTQSGSQTFVLTVLEGCVWFFCRDVKQVMGMAKSGNNEIHGEIVPEKSDFRRGYATWQVYDAHGGTRLRFHASLTPSFWIPPLIGPRSIQKTLAKEFQETATRVEQLANEKNAHVM